MLRVLLIANQPATSDALRQQLVSHQDVVVTGEADEVVPARTLLAGGNYDVAFLDPRFPQGDRLDLAANVRAGARLVMVTTPTDGIIPSLEAIEVEYLLPPIASAALAQVLDRLRAPASRATGPLVALKIGASTRLLPLDDIRTVASSENYTEVSLAAGERLFVRRTMQQWASLLPEGQFARVYRGLFINLNRIGRIERGPRQATRVHFTDGAPPPLEVKRRYWPPLRAKLELWRTLNRTKLPATASGRSIAVLPFANLSADPANEIFCDGISEELLNVLAKIPRLRVAARTSAFFFKGKNIPVPEIARQLGVDFVVEGSVRKMGSRVRITAQLINAADGFHVWSDNFDRELTDIFALQDEIAAEIATNLQLRLGEQGRAPAVDPAAHWLVLEGRHQWNLRTSDGLTRAEAAFSKALSIDARFALAHAGLADVCVVRAMYRLADGAPDAAADLARARAEAQRAVEIDPSLAEPHATLGFALFHAGEFAAAAREFPKAFALNPNYATGYQFYAWTLCAQGRMERALAEYEKSIERDPLSFINLDRHAAMLALARRYPEALAANERAATLRPDVFVGNLSQRAPLLLALGRRAEAVDVARAVRKVTRDFPYRRNSDADAIFVLRQTGHSSEAADYAAEFLERLPMDNYLRGFLLAALGHHDEAWPSLEHTPSIMLPFLYWSEMWDPVRATTDFQRLIAQLGRTSEYARTQAEREAVQAPAGTRASLTARGSAMAISALASASGIDRNGE